MNKGQLLRRNNRSLKSTLMIKHVNHFVDNVSAFIWTKLSIGGSPYNKIDTMGIFASEILYLKCPFFEAKDLDGRMYSVQKPSASSNQVFCFFYNSCICPVSLSFPLSLSFSGLSAQFSCICKYQRNILFCQKLLKKV